jgi:membrane protease YdiL (CAAX protease family)
LSATRQLGVFPILGLWAALCFVAGLYAAWQGYGGRPFAATLTTFALYFLVMLLFAARGVLENLSSQFGSGGAYLLGTAIFLVYLIYTICAAGFAFSRVGIVAGLIFLPLALAASAQRHAPGSWQDFATLAGVWAVVKFLPGYVELWPYPGGRLSYVFTVLLCLNVALAAFVLVRRLGGIGYSIGWGPNWGLYILGSFVGFGCIAIPLGIKMHFIAFAPQWSSGKSLPLASLGILLFTAWPEEFLFRGLLQNLLSKASKSEFAGWWTASVLFGFSHIPNGGFPNWRYVLLASIAGLFYGWIWRKTGSIFASALLHAAVDVSWHFLFLPG